jgi:beta-glucosidase
VGDEAIRIGVQAVLGPNLNLPRSPLAGRAFELFSEDPQLTAELGCQWIHGIQARGVAAVAKHVVCNDSETDRRNMNSVVDESALREVYLWPFEYAARHGVWGMLTAYNRLNGTRCAEHRLVLRDWLKVELES